MDIFRILSRGAQINKKRAPGIDYAFPGKEENNDGKKIEVIKDKVEKETDFFHTHKGKGNTQSVENGQIEKGEDFVKQDIPPPRIACEEDATKLRKAMKSKVTGLNIPYPIGSFEDLIGRYNLDRKVLNNLISSGFVEPTPIQCECIPHAFEGRDLIACAPTGSGKTMAFLVPLVQNILISQNRKKGSGIKGIVISPTNELASQLFQELEILTKGKKSLAIGILSKQLASKINNKVVNPKKFDILICTPLRLIDTIKSENIDLAAAEQMIIDEADKLFEQGFVRQIDEILACCTNPTIQKSMFSATIPSGVEEMANSIMKDPVRVIIGHKEAANSMIEQKLAFTGSEEGKLVAIRQMIQQSEFKPPVLIFLQSIQRAKALFHEVMYDKLKVDVIHSERSPKQRDEVIKRFKSGDIWVLITTDVIARGVDFKAVNLVINYDVPQSAQAYVHRVGRTGRAGRTGKAVTFFTKDDTLAVRPIVNVMKQSGCESGYDSWLENLGKLSKDVKKTIKKKPIQRAGISTVPKVIKQKRKQRMEMIEASKRRKYRQTNVALT